MSEKIKWAIIGLLVLLIPAPIGYLFTQQPVWDFSRENFGVRLWRGHYRSYLLHWCDGHTYRHDGRDGRWVPVVIKNIGTTNQSMRIGYRVIPRFSHAALRPDQLGVAPTDETQP